MDREDLLRALVRLTASGTLDSRTAVPALGRLAAQDAPPLDVAGVLGALREDPACHALAEQLRAARRKAALRAHQERAAGRPVPEDAKILLGGLPFDLPLGWMTGEDALPPLRASIVLLGDLSLLASRLDRAPRTHEAVEKRFRESAQRIARTGVFTPGFLLDLAAAAEQRGGGPRPAIARLRERLGGGADEEAELRALAADSGAFDRLLAWPTDRAAAHVARAVQGPEAEERADLFLALRFGMPMNQSWGAWKNWLETQARLSKQRAERLRGLAERHPVELLLVWLASRDDSDAELRAELEELHQAAAEPIRPDDLVARWERSIPAEEWEAVTGRAPVIHEAPDPATRIRPRTAPPAPKPPEPPPQPAGPSVWEAHLRPFFLENWYLVAGVLMFLVGSSVVAYYTWDKTWLIRYALMPALLGGFTALLARAGAWIEKRDPQYLPTGAVLRGAAIALLPVNFMAVALLANDPDVPVRGLSVPLMGLLYIGLFGWGLTRWCRAVHPSLGLLLGITLLFLDSLVMVGPVAQALDLRGRETLLVAVGAGFYAGFLALAGAVLRFSRRVLTKELAGDKRVVWFFGGTLAVTFLQVFAWVHGQLGDLPQVHTYAPMVVLAGWLVLTVERRSLELQGEPGRLGGESFLGFALLLLGAVMGLPDPEVRIGALVLAGVAWTWQAQPRKEPLHSAIGLTLAVLGGASAALLPGFPRAWIPALGVGISLGLGLLGLVLRGEAFATLRAAASAMQGVLLALTALAAIVLQAAFRSPPIAAGAWLLVVAALLAVRAWREPRLRWVQACMASLALSLPYLGCVDLEGGTLRGNTLAFGLAVLSALWIAVTARAKAKVLLDARSTVLLSYGALAVGGMFVRVFLERGAAPDPLWYRNWMDYTGPLLMTGALAYATWTSRSLVPAFMAVAIAAVLFPAVKSGLRETFPRFSWGSGFGSGVTAVVLAALAFHLRARPGLRSIGDGDLYMGRRPFPVRRLDFSLFTIPLLAAAVFFAAKVETWNFVRNVEIDGLRAKTAWALVLSGVFWTLFAIYHRARRAAPLATWAGNVWILVGSGFLLPRLGLPHAWHEVALNLGLELQAIFLVHRFVLERRAAGQAPLLADPTRRLLQVLAVVLTPVSIAVLFFGGPPGEIAPLLAFLGVQLAWHALASRRALFGSLLFALGWTSLLAWTAPGTGELPDRLSVERSLGPTLWMILAVQGIHVALERAAALRRRLSPLASPFLAATSALAFLIGLWGLADGVIGPEAALRDRILLLASAAVTARALGSGPLALLAVLLGYLLVQPASVEGPERTRMLLEPWRLGALALALAATGHGLRLLREKRPAAVRGAFAPAAFKGPGPLWLQVPACAVAVLAALVHTAGPALREAPVQLWAPFLGAAAVALAAYSARALPLHTLAGILATVGNVHAVRVGAGEFLRSNGLSEIHLACLGIALTLLQLTALRRVVRGEPLLAFIAQGRLAGAALVLALLAANYVTHSDLAAVTWERFMISGSMAFLAGWFFRLAARRPAPGEERFSLVCEGFYHYGVTLALWCFALAIPALRNPVAAMATLAVPLVYFFVRAEQGRRTGRETAGRYRVTAATLGFVLLGFYAFRGVFQLILYPDQPFDLSYYHKNSPVVFLIGIVLLRLHALGGTSWLSFYGGLAVMASSYMALTALRGLSPFSHPAEAAACAVAMAHFWTLASTRRSPLRTAIQRLAGLDEAAWFALRRPWGVCLLVGSHLAVGWALLHWEARPLAFAPLLLGAASVALHHGILRGSALYHWIARIEIAVALHADFLGIESFLPRIHVVWALLGIWAALLAAHQALRSRVEFREIGAYALQIALLAAGHVAWHDPTDPEGFWALAAAGVLAALTPRTDREARTLAQLLPAAALLFVPALLAYFSQANFVAARPGLALDLWPLLVGTSALFLTGVFAALHQRRLAAPYAALPRPQPRLFDQTLAWMGVSGGTIHAVLLSVSFALALVLQFANAGRAFEDREFGLLLGLELGLVGAWIAEGRMRQAMLPTFMAQLGILASYLVLRQHLAIDLGVWRPEYDAAAGLLASTALSGLKSLVDRQPRELRIPLFVATLLVPAATLGWVLWAGLGSPWVLAVVGLESLLFAFMGREDRESPYHAVAVSGFVAFVAVLFWTRFHFRELHAYVIPAGIGVLALVQLFGRRVEPAVRTGVRGVTLVAMLGSAAFYALFDSSKLLAYNLTLILLSLAVMAVGGALRIRLYLVLGFSALAIDLLTLLGRAVAGMERSTRMIAGGSVVVLIGLALVFGAVFYKIHRAEVEAWRDRLRERLASWH